MHNPVHNPVRAAHLVVELHDELDELLAVLLRLGLEVLGDVHNLELGAELLAAPHDRLHRDEVDDALELVLGADGQLDDRGRRAEVLDDHVDAVVEVGAEAVHLVHEADARHLVLVGLAPDRLGLRLDARHGVEHGDGAVEHAQRALDLEREVDVAGRVDDVDAVAVPLARRRRRRDRDAALLLLDHPVHRRRALVHLADLVRLAGVVEDALRRRRLAGVDVRHDADVAVLVERHLARVAGCLLF